MSSDVILELRRDYDRLTQSQKRIAEAIVEDPEFVAFATVDKVAARLGVSPSTVVRFAYRIGLNGYQGLQDSLRITKWARSQGAQVVAVTDTPISPVGQRVDVVLPTLVSGLSAQTSYVAAMAVVNALLNGVIARSPAALDRDSRITALLGDWDTLTSPRSFAGTGRAAVTRHRGRAMLQGRRGRTRSCPTR